MAGLLLLTEEEFRHRRQLTAPPPPACEETKTPSSQSESSESSPLSERQRLSIQLRKLGLREAQIRDQVVLASRDSGKRFTSASEQQQSVHRISRRVVCSRLMPKTSFTFQPVITRLRVSSYASSSPQSSTLPSTLPNSPTASPLPAKIPPKPLSKATLQQYLKALEEPRKAKPRAKPRKKTRPVQSQPVSPTPMKKLSPKSLTLTTQASPVQSFSLSSPKAKSTSPDKKPHTRPRHMKSKSSDVLQPLGRRLLRFAAKEPATFYRAAVNPQLAVLITQRQQLSETLAIRPVRWSASQEALFRKALHGKQRRRATRSYLDQSRGLVPQQDMKTEAWLSDRRSPYVQDRDYHSSTYYAFAAEDRHSPASDDLDASQLEEQQLFQLTGLPPSKPLFVRRKAAKVSSSLREFETAQQSPVLLQQWKHSRSQRHLLQANLSEDILNHLEGETRYIQKARYAYLSARVACQRAHSEAEQRALQHAEMRRQALYQRQLAFQRQLTTIRVLVKRLYPAYPLGKRRVISNSVKPLGHVDFPAQMQHLGLLSIPRPKPEPELSPSAAPVSLPANFSNLLNTTHPKKHPQRDLKRRNHMATRIQAHFRGFIACRSFLAMKRIAAYMKRCFRIRKLRRVFLRVIIRNRKRSANLSSLYQRLRDDEDMRKALAAEYA